ncbi:MAG: hypothetical protein M3015_15385, partial [Bacteroidota bacterium]|nr:hypothetical protein [Bacteroidota bacterium]
RMIEDSVTIIVLGNKYNRAIYDAKKMIPIFQPNMEMDDEEKHSNANEKLMMNLETDSTR